MRRLLFHSLAASVLALASLHAQGSDSTTKTDSTKATGNGDKSVLQGVFTDEQAARGDTEHQTNCTTCHGTEKYTGDAFKQAWVGRTAFDLFDQLKTTMPDDNPGSLSTQQYVDIIAYIFKSNGYPAGTEVLPADPEALRVIKIEAKAEQTSLLSRPTAPHVDSRSRRLRPMYHPHTPISAPATR